MSSSVDDIHTFYGNIQALKGISLTVDEGEIVTLIGSNGAGKTTTLRTISGLHAARDRRRSGSTASEIHALPATRIVDAGHRPVARGPARLLRG